MVLELPFPWLASIGYVPGGICLVRHPVVVVRMFMFQYIPV